MIRQLILKSCIKYLLDNKAPKTISYPEDNPEHFGFWVYLSDGDQRYVLHDPNDDFTYKCTKFDPTEEEKDVIVIKEIRNKNDLFTTDELTVRLFFNGFEISGITPLQACIYGKSGIYKLLKWLDSYSFEKSLKKHRKALSYYKDRMVFLEAIINVYEDNRDSLTTVVDDAVDINTLVARLTKSNDLRALYLSRDKLDPLIRSLESDSLIETIDNGNLKPLPKAWSELSIYALEERRHKDNLNALRWQRILMFFLVMGSLITAFLTFIRPDVQSNIQRFIQCYL